MKNPQKYLFNFQDESNKIDKEFSKKQTWKALKHSIELKKNLLELQKVIDWCSTKKITVFFTRDRNKYLPEDKVIVINKTQNTTKKLLILLHECGHYLIDQSKDKNSTNYNKKYGNGYDFSDDNKKNKTITHKIDILSEEIEAWNRGYSLALRLKLSIDKDKFDREKATSVKTYAFWAAHSK